MSKPRTAIFITLGRRHFGAIEAKLARSGAEPTGPALHERLPTDLDPADAQAVGQWLRDRLRDAGFKAKRAVLCLERRDAIVKRLAFDSVPDPEADLPGMVRFQMQRQLTFPADNAAIDYTLLPTDEKGDDTRVVVHAVAAPGARTTHLAAVLRAAGLEHTRTALTAEGLIALLGRGPLAHDDAPSLVVAPTPDGFEFIVAHEGRPAAARWERIEAAEPNPTHDGTPHAESAPGEDTADNAVPIAEEHREEAYPSIAQALAAEARRTWMTHQLSPGATPIGRALVVSDPDAEYADNATAAIASAIGKDATRVTTADIDHARTTSAALLPLLGAAHETADHRLAPRRIDLLHPRTPPDRAARTRQLAMAGVLVILLTVGGIYTAGRAAVAEKQQELDRITAKRTEALNKRSQAIRRAARAEHIARYLAGSASPTANLADVTRIKPPSDSAILDGFSMRAEAGVGFDFSGRLRWYDHERWAASKLITIGFRSLADSRATADRLRDAFVDAEVYTVETTGADGDTVRNERYPHRIDLRLTRYENELDTALAGAAPEPTPPADNTRAEAAP